MKQAKECHHFEFIVCLHHTIICDGLLCINFFVDTTAFSLKFIQISRWKSANCMPTICGNVSCWLHILRSKIIHRVCMSNITTVSNRWRFHVYYQHFNHFFLLLIRLFVWSKCIIFVQLSAFVRFTRGVLCKQCWWSNNHKAQRNICSETKLQCTRMLKYK